MSAYSPISDDDRPLPGRTEGTEHVHIRTFLIADVRGYTLFTQERGDEAATKLAARFADVAREVVREHGGSVIELRGDEALAAFDSARQAILAAAHAQERFLEETVADPSFPLPVGIGLDAGEAVPLEAGYRGGALNLAARLCGRAGPGEILASQGVVHLARKVEGVRYLDRGDLHLKGLEEPIHVVRVISEQGDPAEGFRRLAPRPKRGPAPVRLARRHPIAAVLVALALIAAVAVPTTIAIRGGGPSEPIAGDAVGIIDLESGELTGQPVQLGSRPGDLAVGEGGVWVTLPDRGEVVQIDPETGSVRDTIPVGADPSGIAVGAGFIWVANSDSSTVSKISPDTKREVKKIQVPAGPAGIAVGSSGVWVVSSYHDSVSRIDPQTEKVVDTVPVGDEPVDVALDDHGVWVASAASKTVSRVDPDLADEVQQIPLSSSPRAIDAGTGGIWVASLEGTVSRIDPDANTVPQTISVGGAPSDVALGGGSVWVSDEAQGSVARIEPGSDSVSMVTLGSQAGGLAIGQGVLWVGVRGPDAAHRGGMLTAFAPAPGFFNSIDPAVAYDDIAWNILGLAHDGLVGFKRVGGLEGTTLVPNLATSTPTPTNGGKTYTFQLRPDIRYSNGEPVRADDFRRSIERIFANGSGAVPYFLGILGAKACEPRNPCDLSRGIVADDDAGTVTFHLTAPDPEFLYALSLPFAFAVPAETPDRLSGTTPIPATGPYVIERIEKSTKKGLIVRVWLARNPEFIERPGRPDGFPDRIVWRFAATPRQGDRQVDEVLAGSADFMRYVPNDRLPELAASHPGQLHRLPTPSFWSMSLNNQTPPFDDALVRRAINLAVDRKKIAGLLRDEGASTCQILPPAFPGYEPYCPYSRHPDTSWTAPDIAKAQDLIAESGTAGSRVIVWASRDYYPVLPGHVPVSRYFVHLLDGLGYDATLKVVTIEEYDAIWYPSRHVQMALWGWGQDYPAESGFMLGIVTCGSINTVGNTAGFCHPDLDRRMEEATALQLTDPVAAHRQWSRIEHDIVDLAPWVPLVNSLSRTLVSERVGNFQYSPQWGPLVDQMWVR